MRVQLTLPLEQQSILGFCTLAKIRANPIWGSEPVSLEFYHKDQSYKCSVGYSPSLHLERDCLLSSDTVIFEIPEVSLKFELYKGEFYLVNPFTRIDHRTLFRDLLN